MAQQGFPAIGEEVPQSLNRPTAPENPPPTTPPNQPATTTAPAPSAKLPAIGEEVPSSLNAPHIPSAAAAPPATWGQTAADYADYVKGYFKMGVRDVKSLVDDVPHYFGGMGASDYIDLALGRPPGTTYENLTQANELQNMRQRVGAGAEIATFAVPSAIGAAKNVFSTAKAAQSFNDIMRAAATQYGDLGPTALSALQAEDNMAHGASGYPTVVKKFLDEYVHNPNAPATTYQEIRKWATNFNDIALEEKKAMSGIAKAHVADMKVLVNQAAADAAAKVGKGADYIQAMNDYAAAKRNQAYAWAALKGTAIGGLLVGGERAAQQYGSWLYKKAGDLLP